VTIQIDKNIPIPEPANQGSYATDVRRMEIGDSVLVLTKKEAKGVAQAIRNAGFKQTSRNVDGGIRVWKMERIVD
jgi:hypothetical protein